jgi:hypothetical protein
MEWLLVLLSSDDSLPGAEESFPFLFAAVADAKLYALPEIFCVFENFFLDDLRFGRIRFVVSQLATAFEFIQSQVVSIPLTFLLPFPPQPPTPPICRPGFAIYAFPLFAKAPTAFSVGFSARGGDAALVWQHECPDLPASEFLDTVATVDGTLFIVRGKARLIKVDTRPPEESSEEVAIVSNLMLMLRQGVPSPRTSIIPELLNRFVSEWKINKTEDARLLVIELIGRLQNSLRQRGVLPGSYVIRGIVDPETLEALSKAFPFPDDRCVVSPQMFALLTRCREVR